MTAGRVLVTGANGFVGGHLVDLLAREFYSVVPVVRTASAAGQLALGDLSTVTSWGEHLTGVDVVVHLAARVHQMNDSDSDALYRQVNVDVTLSLASEAARCGVRRFIFLSSIKVNGECTGPGEAFSAAARPEPEDAYGRSKLAAEQELRILADATGMELVIIRPPLVYGPGVKANFYRLLQLADSPLPLPLATVSNRRDMVSVYNLCDLILCCLAHSSAAGNVFLVSDGRPYSTAELVRVSRIAQGRRPLLFPLSPALLKGLLRLLGRGAMAERLLGNLEVDISHTAASLDWVPPYSLEATLGKML